MTTVWTASSLRRQDGRYNSLSRSLGSLMSIVLDEDKSPSVLIFSNQSPRETNLQTSVSVGDRVGDENILPLNGLSFRSLQTDSSSSIAFVGKKIKREYQSAFVLPDKQTIGIIRQEAFMTEEGLAQVTLSLCVSTDVDSLKVSKSERICDYLDTDYWASILLASTESHDTELLGYMGPEYTSRKPNRFNFERSESRRRKREIVLVQEEIEDSDEKDNVGQFDGSNILPESVTVYEKVYPKEKDECDPQTRRLILHPPPPLPPPQLPESPLPSPPKTLKVSERNASPKPQLTSSRNSCQPKEQAPIIGRAEPPGKTKPIVSSPKSKENFEKLKRQWNNRIAQMQEHLDNQYRDTPTSLPQTYTEGHRGSTVTSILPTVDKRSSDPYVKGRISSTDQRLSPEQAYDHQSLPDRTSMDHGSNKENFIYHSFDYISSSSPGSGDLVDPVTERCEKEAQFIYSQARLFVNQQNIGRLSPRKLSESSSMNDITKLKTSNLNHQQFEQLLIDNTVKYTELNNNNQSSISFIIDKFNIEQSSKQAYIYQSTYSRLPITIKNISSYHQNNNNKLITNKINNTMIMKELFNKFAKHELILNREPTYSFHIPIQLSTTEFNLHQYSKTLPRYNNKYEMIIHVNDLHNSLDNNNDMNMKQSIRHRMYTSLPRTKHALLYYSQPISSRIVSNSSILEDRQQQDIRSEFRNGSDLTYHGKTSYSDIYYKDDPSTDRSEEFIKTLTKYKASSEINYSTKNRILLDIDQNQSPILTGPQLYPSSTDLSSLLSPGGDNFKSYLNRYVERSEKYWSLPKSYFIADEQINKNETTTKQYDSMNITLKDLIYDKFKPLSPTTEAKTDIKLTSNQDTDNLNLHFLKPYKSYRTITTNEKNSQRIKEINQNEKFNTDDLLSKAYYDEMNRLSKRKSLKMDELSSTSSLSILAKAYEEQIENHRKQIDRKSTSIKGNGSKTTDELGEHKSSSKPMKQMNEQENKLMQSDISSDHQRNNLTRDEEVTKFDVQKPSKPEVISNLPPSVLDIPKRLEQNDRLSKHKDLKPDITHQIVTDDKISEKSHKDHLNDQMSKQQELKHHRHPPPPLHHHKSSTKDEILEKFISTGDTHKRSCDGPMSFANFKKNMISDNLPVDEEHSHHQGRHLSHDESKVFSRDSKFRKPIHNNEGQTGTPLAPKHSFEDKHTNKSKMEQQIKTEKPKTQPLDTKASRTSEENHGESMKDQERNELVKRNKTHHQSLRSKQNKPHTSITSKNDRISSWVENSRYQTRQLLQDGMIDVVPQAQPQKSDLKRHQSLNEKRNSYKTDDKMKYRHSDDPSKKPIKKDSITSDYIASQPPKSHYKLNDQKDPTKPLDSNQLNKIDSLKDTHKKSIIEKQQQQDRNNKDNIVKIPDIKQEEKYSSNNVRKQHPSNEVNNLDVEQSVGEIPPHSKQSNSSKIKQPLKEYDGKQSRQSIKKQSYTKDNDDDDDDEGKRENLAKNTDEVLNRSKQSSELDQHKKRKDNVPYRTVDRGNRHLTTTETRSKVTDELPGHRRHPPPPLSPNSKEDIHYPRDGTVSRPRIPDGSKAATPLTPTRHSLKNLDDDPEKRKRQQKLYDDEFKNINGEPMPLDPRKPTTQFNYGILQHPDEYNYLAEAEKQKPTIDFASELSYDSSLYGKISQGSARKQPSIKHYDKYKDKKPDKPHRHPPPPQPTDHDQTKRLDDKPSPKADRRSGRGMVSVDENYYVNVPGSGPPVIRPPYNGHKRSLQDLSERSGPHSAYDPRLGDTVIHPSKPRTSDRISDQMPDYYDQYTSDESDYDDSGESDEELKPPALRTITQTRRRSEPEPSNNYPPVQLRKQSKGQKTGQSITSIRDSLISPEGKYMKGLDRDHSNGMSQERISRPRSKHTTATSRSSGYYGVNVVNDTSSKHSLIISTKRRTLSGLTGTHPSKHRSSSMNTLWFGDHPVPSEHTISPATPVRLSNIQIQAQAELERRHRSSSHGHSLDRKSIYSTGMTESHLSKGLSDYHQGYEGIGYAYDNRGRLIHGGACLPERSASRKRRLLDGHESLSRVWIPQSGEHYPVKQISDKTANSLMNRDERQAQLDNSAMAFALRDFNAPKIR
ncbi:unnamed protein product [Schistosoma margrebowiei]|uniref:Uncharacterized protein n=1 Tax=Schistosoma margrebowiei TaxID=48269 RepID=A0AA85AAV2_9TREM|nr:unnamed protein product [Schistosoma margrebowiei]